MANDHIPQSRPIVTRAKAMALGLTVYFTGKSCKHGHISERRIGNCSCRSCELPRMRAYMQNKNKKNPEENREKVKKWQRENRNHRNAYIRQWRLDNYDREVARARTNSGKWKKENPLRYLIKCRNDRHRRDALLKDAGSFKLADIERIFKAQKGKCAECRASLKDGYQIDHIIALARGGSNLPRNLQLMCTGACNQKKGARDPIEHARSVGRLL